MNTAGPARNEISVGGISTTIVSSVSELPDSLLRQSWRTASVALEPGHLVSSAADRRWLTTFVLARIGARPVGFLALLQRRTREFPDSIFDPADVAPGLFGTRGTSASQYLLIGGATELVSGTATAAEADARTARDIQSALVEAGFQAARDGGLTGAALYVRETELAAFLGPADSPRPHQATGDFAALRLPSGGMAGYLASLNHRHRSVVRRDLSRLEALGLYGREVAATDIAAEAAPLVLAVKRRHGVRDYQALVSYRLARWSAESFGERIAFAVRSPRDGRLLAVSFGCASWSS